MEAAYSIASTDILLTRLVWLSLDVLPGDELGRPKYFALQTKKRRKTVLAVGFGVRTGALSFLAKVEVISSLKVCAIAYARFWTTTAV